MVHRLREKYFLMKEETSLTHSINIGPNTLASLINLPPAVLGDVRNIGVIHPITKALTRAKYKPGQWRTLLSLLSL